MSLGNINTQGHLCASYGMLAKAGLFRLDFTHPGKVPCRIDVYSLNLIRMLELYRYGNFLRDLKTGETACAPLSLNTFALRAERAEARFVFRAIKSAHIAVSALPRVEFVLFMQSIFTAAYNESLTCADAARIDVAKAFLIHLVAKLHECTGFEAVTPVMFKYIN